MLISPPGARTPLRSPSASRLCFTRGALVAMLDMSSNSAFQPRLVNVRMHSIDFCHPCSKNEHPCLGDSRFVPRSCPRSLIRGSASSRRLTRCDVPSSPGWGRCLPLAVADKAVSQTPLSSLPAAPQRFRVRSKPAWIKTTFTTPSVKGAWLQLPEVPSACRDPPLGRPRDHDFAA